MDPTLTQLKGSFVEMGVSLWRDTSPKAYDLAMLADIHVFEHPDVEQGEVAIVQIIHADGNVEELSLMVSDLRQLVETGKCVFSDSVTSVIKDTGLTWIWWLWVSL